MAAGRVRRRLSTPGRRACARAYEPDATGSDAAGTAPPAAHGSWSPVHGQRLPGGGQLESGHSHCAFGVSGHSAVLASKLPRHGLTRAALEALDAAWGNVDADRQRAVEFIAQRGVAGPRWSSTWTIQHAQGKLQAVGGSDDVAAIATPSQMG